MTLIDWAFDGIALWEPDPWRVDYANPAFWQAIGAQAASGPEGALNDALSALPGPLIDLLEEFRTQIGEAITTTLRLEVNGVDRSIEVRLCRVAKDDDFLIGMILRSSATDQATGLAARDAARLDPLTGLPDREFLMQRITRLLAGERAADRQFALVFLDLDNFKQVNDEFGHLFGDKVLREAARRIAQCLRGGDHVVRFGGDEFVALIGGVTTADEVEPVVSRIHLALAKPIVVATGEVTLSLSAGMAVAANSGGSAEELLAEADRAMYASKRNVV